MVKQSVKKNRQVISIHIETYKQLKEIAARDMRTISSQVRYLVEQDMQRGQVHDQPETVQTAR